MARIDSVRRECEDIGTWLSRYKRNPEAVRNPEAEAALAEIHKKALAPEPEPTLLFQQLDDFRQKYDIPATVAPSYRASAG
jgi:hypothetical protein